MADEKKMMKVPHTLILENRKSLTATGVSDVDSFDEQTIVAYTEMGELTVKGRNLHISRLNVDTGELTLDGEITSMYYTDSQPAGKGFFSRLFK